MLSLFNELLQQNSLALDIDDRQIKLAERREDGFKYSNLDLKPGVIQAGQIKDQQYLKQKLKEAITDNDFKSRQVVIGINSKHIDSEVIQLPPGITKKEIKEKLEFQFSTEDIYYSYQKMAAKDNQEQIMTISANKDLIEQYLNLMKNLRLKALAIEPKKLALIRFFEQFYEREDLAMVHLGENITNVMVIKDNKLLFNRDIEFGNYDILQEIKRRNQLEAKEANRYKKAEITEKECIIITERLVTQIYRSLDYFQAEYSNFDLEDIVLTGVGSDLKELDNYLLKRLGLDTKIAQIKIGNKQNILAEFLVAASLSLREER